jgi:hypothetical protein
MKSNSKKIWCLAVAFLLLVMLVIGAFLPDNVLQADVGDEQEFSSFLPVILGFTANNNLGTPTSTAELTATAEATPITMTPTATDILTETPTATMTSLPCMSGDGNLIRNPGFESDTADWNFFTNEQGEFKTVSPGYECL